ncbi:MAG: alkaline phosphatase D family protein [Myxococcota bacterium]|nr:alkaline phosphatase D family protein [Myxococcota bacterium]
MGKDDRTTSKEVSTPLDTEHSFDRRDFLKQTSLLTVAGVLGCESDAYHAADSDTVLPPGDGVNSTEDISVEDADAGAPEDTAPPQDTGPPDIPRYEFDGVLGPATMFSHGVASGDPLANAVILWTRVSPGETNTVAVWWEVSLTADFSWRVASGTFMTDAARDYTVKVDVTGLDAETTYFYRFFAQGRESMTGRTRTAGSGAMAQARFAVASCSNYARGYFTAYRNIAERSDLDAVLHLGDYIYEYAGGSISGRAHMPDKEIITLDDYRQRYAQYRSDADLQEAHRQHPFIVVWDDHESSNNSWKNGAANHNPATEGAWQARRSAAVQAYHEWQPIREQSDYRIFRKIQYGDLLDLIMLDTRLFGRDQQINAEDLDLVNDPSRSLLGAEQEQWLSEQLLESTAQWTLIGQQVVLFPLQAAGVVLNNDQWDAYQPSRDRFFDAIEDGARENVVVLTGDIHSSWASQCPRNADTWANGAGALAVEFVTPGITSGSGFDPGLVYLAQQLNPHIAYGDVQYNGYMVIDVTPDRTQAAWFHLDTVFTPEGIETFSKAYSVNAGSRQLEEDDLPATGESERPLAP